MYSVDFTGASLLGITLKSCRFGKSLKLEYAKVESLDWPRLNFGPELMEKYVVIDDPLIDHVTLNEYYVIELMKKQQISYTSI